MTTGAALILTINSGLAASPPHHLETTIAAASSETSAAAVEQHSEPPALSLTTVDQLADIAPTDWAYQMLQATIERYGCLEGYPDGAFRGDRSLSRYEFAAGLNTCLAFIASLATADEVATSDLEALQRLQHMFNDELAALDAQIIGLEARAVELEAVAFATTTKLRGEIVFSLEQLAGGDQANGGGEALPQSSTFGSRVRLNFDTRFTGSDLLRVRLDALNPAFLNAPVTGTNMTRLAFDRDTNNDVDIGKLFYRFLVSDNFSLHLDAARGAYQTNVSSTFNPGISSPISGAVSRFGRFNPIYYQGFPGTGITGVYDLSADLSLSLGYLARDNGAADPDTGLFGGGYTALAQLDFRPTENLELGLTYAHSYYPAGSVAASAATGSRLANAPFGNNAATSADHLGLQSSLKLGTGANLSGWAGLSFANAESSGGQATAGDSATVVNWAVTLGLPHLGGRGNLSGIIVGQPPRVTRNTGGPVDDASAWHLEVFYRDRINQNISIIPGFFVVLNPEHNSNNDAIWLASFRTVFQF